ncbi:amidohydrolase family protein [Streptomyces olivaceoviridis]|uniref:amidohydrolase family protein n=1 Tax=Streptomyces olivaceoviridis TaxID=1921 RepID=UPI00368CD3D2
MSDTRKRCHYGQTHELIRDTCCPHVRWCGTVRPLCAAHRARSDRGERGGAVTPGSMAPHASQYTVDELRTMVEDAHRRGLRVAAHAHGNRAVLDAVEAGVDTLEHVSFLNTRGLRSPRRGADRDRRWHGVRQWDTGCRPEGIGGAADGHRRAARPYPRGLRSAARARRPPGGGFRRRNRPVRTARRAAPPGGRTPRTGPLRRAALSAVSAPAAGASGLGDRKGRIRAGYDADLLAAEGDPALDAAAHLNVAGVFRSAVGVR